MVEALFSHVTVCIGCKFDAYDPEQDLFVHLGFGVPRLNKVFAVNKIFYYAIAEEELEGISCQF
jgi:hypothetical protein